MNGALVHCWGLLIAFQIKVYGCRTRTQLAAEGTARGHVDAIYYRNLLSRESGLLQYLC